MWHGQTSDPQVVVGSPPKSQRFPPDRWYVMMETYTRTRDPAWWCLSVRRMPLSIRWWPRGSVVLSPHSSAQRLPGAPPEPFGSQAESYCRPSWAAIGMSNSVVPGSGQTDGGQAFPSPK